MYHAQGDACRIGHMDIEHILCEFMYGISSRRRPAHMQLEGGCREVAERGFDLHPVVFWFREAQSIGDRRLREGGTGDDPNDESKNSGSYVHETAPGFRNHIKSECLPASDRAESASSGYNQNR